MANIPVTPTSAIAAKQAQRADSKMLAEQVASNLRFTEEVELEGFNPVASSLFQARLNRFRPIDERKRILAEKEDQKIQEVSQKAEEDLAKEFYKRNDELPVERLLKLKRTISQATTEQEIIDVVSSTFTDATLADEALEYLDRASTGELKERVKRARALFTAEKGREILAGRNITTVAKSFHNKGLGESPTELRELYRGVTKEFQDHNTLFKVLSEKYQFDDMKTAVAFLLQGLAYDLKSKGPSIQEAELLLLMGEVRNLQSILWVYFFFKGRMKLIRSLMAKYGLSLAKGLSFERLAKEFIKLVEERYPTILKLTRQMEDLGLEDPGKIVVLSQYRDAIRELSPRVYKSPRHQQDLLMTILETLEELEEKIDEEDEEEE